MKRYKGWAVFTRLGAILYHTIAPTRRGAITSAWAFYGWGAKRKSTWESLKKNKGFYFGKIIIEEPTNE